jgi:enoyl-CoA hydratase/carnithine racemase
MVAVQREFVRLDVDAGVGTIRLDRPPANALSRQVSTELAEAVAEAGGRDDVASVIVSGGPKLFSGGADIKEMAGLGPEEMRPIVSTLGDALIRLEALPKITIAAIEGFALGGGCELAIACDVRIASREAQLGQPEIKIGIIPGAGGTQRLVHLVGLAHARDLVYSGRTIQAEEALAWGLVDELAPTGETFEAALARARAFADGPRDALAAAKEALAASRLGDPRVGLGAERDLFVGLFATEDQKEGTRAFAEKREPRFGRART